MLIHLQVWVLVCVCVCVCVPGWCERSEGLSVACSWWAPGPETAGGTAGTPVPETRLRLHLQTNKRMPPLNTLHSANAPHVTAESQMMKTEIKWCWRLSHSPWPAWHPQCPERWEFLAASSSPRTDSLQREEWQVQIISNSSNNWIHWSRESYGRKKNVLFEWGNYVTPYTSMF